MYFKLLVTCIYSLVMIHGSAATRRLVAPYGTSTTVLEAPQPPFTFAQSTGDGGGSLAALVASIHPGSVVAGAVIQPK